MEGLSAEGEPNYDAGGFSGLVVGAVTAKRGGVPVPGLPLSVRLANLPTVALTTGSAASCGSWPAASAGPPARP